MVVDEDSSLWALRSSSSCASRMMVWDKLEAKPKVGFRNDELEPYIACR